MPDQLLTAPIYDPTEAARLAQISTGRVRRWLFGYTYNAADRTKRQQAPVLKRGDDEERLVSFHDLIELRFARGFLEAGLSLQKVRAAFLEAYQIIGQDHPFARKRFFASGRDIYLEVLDRSDADHLLQLLSGGQWVIKEIVLEYARQLDFDLESKVAVRWWPLGKESPVILDPQFSFGAPTIARKGIRTLNLHRLYLGEGRNASRVARWMNVSVDEVEAAVRFETEWSPRKAA